MMNTSTLSLMQGTFSEHKCRLYGTTHYKMSTESSLFQCLSDDRCSIQGSVSFLAAEFLRLGPRVGNG